MAERKDPYKGFRFLVEFDGVIKGGFSEVKIPDSTQEPIEYREGDEPPTVRKQPGLIKYANISLKRGTTDSLDLWKWRKLVQDGKMKEARKSMAIIILDEERNAVARWDFENAWPTKYDAPDLKATGNEIAIESMDIVHEGMERTQ